METNVCPKTWMVESILATIFCCLPLGIAGIVNASKVTTLFADGKVEAAQAASANAKKWTLWAFFIGLGFGVLNLIVYFIYGATMLQGMYSGY